MSGAGEYLNVRALRGRTARSDPMHSVGQRAQQMSPFKPPAPWVRRLGGSGMLLAAAIVLVAGCSRGGDADDAIPATMTPDQRQTQGSETPSMSPPPGTEAVFTPAPTPSPESPSYLPLAPPSPSPSSRVPTPVVSLGQLRGTIPIAPSFVSTPAPTARIVPTAMPTATYRPLAASPTATPVKQSDTPPTATAIPPTVSTQTVAYSPTPLKTLSYAKPDPRYAVILHVTDPEAQRWFLDKLGTIWFIDGTADVDDIPTGHEKII